MVFAWENKADEAKHLVAEDAEALELLSRDPLKGPP